MDNSNNQFQPNPQNSSPSNTAPSTLTPSNPVETSSLPTFPPMHAQSGLGQILPGPSAPPAPENPAPFDPLPSQPISSPWASAPNIPSDPTSSTPSSPWPHVPQTASTQTIPTWQTPVQPETSPEVQAPPALSNSFNPTQNTPLSANPLAATIPSTLTSPLDNPGSAQPLTVPIPNQNNTGSIASDLLPPSDPYQPPSSNPLNQSSQYFDPNTLAANNFQTGSPLDNPFNAPIQPPAIDAGSQQQSHKTPNLPTPQQPPAWSPPPAQSNANPTSQDGNPATPPEQAPTDLSHLISNTNSSNAEPPITPQPETIVVPTTTSSLEVPTIPTENKGGIPKWVIGLGVGLLIIVAGASAYFILGVGQAPKNTSMPATEAPSTNQQTNNPAPVATTNPEASSIPQASGSTNFGQLQGSGSAPQASSAADILKARQQQQGR